MVEKIKNLGKYTMVMVLIITITIVLPCTSLFAGSKIDTYIKEVQSNFEKATQMVENFSGRKINWYRKCPVLVYWQLNAYGICAESDPSSKYGKDMAKEYAKMGSTKMGYNLFGYPCTKDTASSTLDSIINSHNGNVKYIIISFDPGNGLPKEGHVMLISRIEDGMVYFVDNTSYSKVNGNYAAVCMSLDEFKSKYFKWSANCITVATTDNQGNDPQGWLDSATVSNDGLRVTCVGWNVDKDDLSESIYTHLYFGGPAGAADAKGFSVKASSFREDVDKVFPGYGKYHGFVFEIETKSLGGLTGWVDVYAYGINIDGGENKLLDGCPKKIYIEPLEETYSENCMLASYGQIPLYIPKTFDVSLFSTEKDSPSTKIAAESAYSLYTGTIFRQVKMSNGLCTWKKTDNSSIFQIGYSSASPEKKLSVIYDLMKNHGAPTIIRLGDTPGISLVVVGVKKDANLLNLGFSDFVVYYPYGGGCFRLLSELKNTDHWYNGELGDWSLIVPYTGTNLYKGFKVKN